MKEGEDQGGKDQSERYTKAIFGNPIENPPKQNLLGYADKTLVNQGVDPNVWLITYRSYPIETQDEEWKTPQQTRVLNQVLKLRTMLRLAPDRAESLKENPKLSFQVTNQRKDLIRLVLKNKGMYLEVKGFDNEVLNAVPMLEGQVHLNDK